MVYDYLGLGTKGNAKRLSKKDDGFINMNSDYLGLGEFAVQRSREIGKARRYVKGQVKSYREDYNEIKKEAQAFRNDVGRGGWIGDYIRRKTAKPKPRKFANSKF